MSNYPVRPVAQLAKALLAEPFKDERGVIQPLVDGEIGGAAIIHSKKGAFRANHYHKNDWHYCYVIHGHIAYYHRPAGNTENPIREEFRDGDIFYSPSMVEHTMEFLQDTVFIVLSGLPREHADYEEDIVRVEKLAKI